MPLGNPTNDRQTDSRTSALGPAKRQLVSAATRSGGQHTIVLSISFLPCESSLTVRTSTDGEPQTCPFVSARHWAPIDWHRPRRVQTELALEKLSGMLLDQAAPLLGDKRLLIVSDGALQYIPFAALPAPEAELTDSARVVEPLGARHEIVGMPSASMLAVLRDQLKGRQPPEGLVAVLADPSSSSTIRGLWACLGARASLRELGAA